MGGMDAALCFFPSCDASAFPHLLIGGICLQDGRHVLRKGTADVRLEDDLKILNPLKLAKLHNRPTGSVGSRTKKSKPDQETKTNLRSSFRAGKRIEPKFPVLLNPVGDEARGPGAQVRRLGYL